MALLSGPGVLIWGQAVTLLQLAGSRSAMQQCFSLACECTASQQSLAKCVPSSYHQIRP